MILRAPQAVLREFHWKRVEASARIGRAQFDALVRELRGEDCLHSWKWIAWAPGEDAARAVRRYETALRPTTVYCYYGVRKDGGKELFGAGTVSSRLRRSLGLRGFPVIARGFIRRKFRGRRLYALMLDHRIAVCERRWKKGLRGIHLGTATPAVRSLLPSRGFIKIGREALNGKGPRHLVDDYLRPAKGVTAEALRTFREAIPVIDAKA